MRSVSAEHFPLVCHASATVEDAQPKVIVFTAAETFIEESCFYDSLSSCHRARFRRTTVQQNSRNFSATVCQPMACDRRRALVPSRFDNSASRRSRRAAWVNCSTDAPSSRIPVSPSTIASGTPPSRPPIAGFPQAAASRKTRPNPSVSPFDSVQFGITKMSQLR